jgi:predicted protein tyrosine phosphatase
MAHGGWRIGGAASYLRRYPEWRHGGSRHLVARGRFATGSGRIQTTTNWEWTLNWDEVRTDLVIGSCPMTTADIDRVRSGTGATALLSLQTDECRSAFAIDYEAHREHGETAGLAMVNVPMRDFDPPDQRRHLPDAVRTLTTMLSSGHKVYLHCTAGLNRAPLTVLGYLSFIEMVAPEEALAFIRQVRPAAEPSWEAYWGCRSDLAASLNYHVHVRAYYLSEQHPETDTQRNWYQAEADVIRQALLSPRSLLAPRLDPNRA